MAHQCLPASALNAEAVSLLLFEAALLVLSGAVFVVFIWVPFQDGYCNLTGWFSERFHHDFLISVVCDIANIVSIVARLACLLTNIIQVLYSGADFLTRIIEEAVLNGAQEKEIACDAPHKRKREEERRKS